MADTIVFYEPGALSLSSAATSGDTLVFAEPGGTALSTQSVDPDLMLLVEKPVTTTSVVEIPSEVLLIASPPTLTSVDFFTGGDTLAIISGGPPGAPGPVGPAAVQYEASFNFPSAATSWVMPHNQNTKALSVVTFDINGAVIEGDIEYTTGNTITVNWYYPVAGSAIVFD